MRPRSLTLPVLHARSRAIATRYKTDANAAAIVKRCYERPKEELYDVRNDPHEQRNLAADPKHAKRLTRMRAQLEAWMTAQNDSRKIFNQPRPLSDPASTKPATLEPSLK